MTAWYRLFVKTWMFFEMVLRLTLLYCHGLRSPVLEFSRYHLITKFKFLKHFGDYLYEVDSLRNQKAKRRGLWPVSLAVMVKLV
jgi:hypothetical protein